MSCAHLTRPPLSWPVIPLISLARSDWPTIPQLYVNGEFVGGCDILTTMHNDGELGAVLAEAAPPAAERA